MNRSIAAITVLAGLGLAACTSTPAPDNAPTTTTSATAPSAAVKTEVVTETVTKPVAQPPPAKPVIGSFGYGPLKLGMTLQQAMDTKLIGPNRLPSEGCTSHQILGTDQWVYVSPTVGVATIPFTAAMTADGAGVGATEAKLKEEYTNLEPAGPNYTYKAKADGNPNATFVFTVQEGKVTVAYISVANQECHN
ncbi:hypothetical protein ACFWNN_24520 [Lentzea sp. NPDC058450]|uniref:hypothetical protein n=1 Tax=Lentzea sp. NPDC058450 TaxID=3346505 RepID=UPI0036495260